MTLTDRFATTFLTTIAAIGCSCGHQAGAAEQPGTGVAVVELFTSEGCSSCPSADEAVGDLIRSHQGQPVYVLAFHVDYWNDLGWIDPFSQKAFTERQQNYRRLLRLDNVYTPQVVINGKVEFVGSNRAKLQAAVAEGLATPTAGSLSVVVTREGETAKAAVSAKDLPSGTIVLIALVQTTASTVVPRGENGGRTLKHDNVVRAFASVTLNGSGQGSATLNAPSGGWPGDGTVIVYAQRPDDGHVLAATSVAFPK